MTQACTPLSLVEGDAFQRMVTHLDTSIKPTTRSKLTWTLIPQKLHNTEIEVSTLLVGVSCVVISYDL